MRLHGHSSQASRDVCYSSVAVLESSSCRAHHAKESGTPLAQLKDGATSERKPLDEEQAEAHVHKGPRAVAMLSTPCTLNQ